MVKEVFIIIFALAEHDQLHVALQDIVRRQRDEVQPLMVGQPRDDGEKRRIRRFGQRKHALQLGLIDRLSGGVLRGIRGEQFRVVRGIVIGRVDAVEDAAQLALMQFQHMVQAAGEFGREDFARIGGADGGDRVRADDGAFHQVDAARIVEHAALPLGQLEHVAEDVEAVHALIGDVMDGKNGLDFRIAGRQSVFVFQIHDRQRALPVVRVQDVGHKADDGQQFQRRLAEEGVALAVVILAVERSAFEIIFVIDKVIGHAVADAGKNPAVLLPPRERDGDALDERKLGAVFFLHRAVQRQDDAHVAIPRRRGGDGRRQRADHVPQPAGRSERQRLGGDEQNLFHGKSVSSLPGRRPAQTVAPLRM